ncbi:hypothetical protein B0H34DRAFT_702732 [Crassisporium funariophilum]|nr:hypothetical protein B0H34DRAFT_702732 [Crassisporium funariophilum]
MARGNPGTPPAAASLPKVSFTIVLDELSKLPAGTKNKHAVSFGYNDFSDFSRSDNYIKHIEPLESDLAKTVEYDMDEQDEEWLKAVNASRKKDQQDAVEPEWFEVMMDRLEKEWFDLTKNIPKQDFAMPSEDSTCAICDDSEGENSNAIVFCDGCNLAVHQDCYGVPYIPEGQWLCRKCTVSPENPVECILCPNEGGAFKQTVHGEWLHLLCAIWIPETRVANDVFMEPVTGVERISKQRWKLRCSICDVREGACIQCAKSSCFLAFHATCARKEKLLLPMKSAQGAEPVTLTCYCERHLPKEQQDVRMTALAAEDSHNERMAPNTQLAAKSARAYAKTYKPGPPLVPAIVVDRIMHYTAKIKLRKKIDFVQMLCRYWSLKREARRGAPLLKRLHLEPWTANATTKVQTEEEKVMRLEQLERLRHDLVNVAELTQLCLEREAKKLRQIEVIHEVFFKGLFVHTAVLRGAFERIMALDRKDHFKNPVSRNDVPDYFDIVKHPMCWSIIDGKLDQHEYWDISAFRHDVELVARNALLYNKAGTVFHKDALRIQKDSKPILDELERTKVTHNVSSQTTEDMEGNSAMAEDGDPGSFKLPPIGDLEPPLDALELLLQSDAIKDDLNLELDHNPIVSLFNYEFAKMKPPPEATLTPSVPPPPRRPPRKPKPKRDRKAEAERARANREAREAAAAEAAGVEIEAERLEWKAEMKKEREQDMELQAALDSSAGFRAPRTRGARAAAAAFEAEAHSVSASASASAGPSGLSGSSISEGGKLHRGRKRTSVAPVAMTSVPRVVNDVGNRDSFSMFNAGWILPPDQKRGGRVPTERQALPPPRKKARLDHGSSRLSIVSTAASDNQTLRRSPLPWSSDPADVKHDPGEDEMDVDATEDEALYGEQPRRPFMESASRGGSIVNEDDQEIPHNVVKQPNGVVVIEKLDTPATRREKNLRRKAEKQKLVALATGSSGPPLSAGSSGISSAPRLPTSSSLAQPAKRRSRGADDRRRLYDNEDRGVSESELSELSSEVCSEEQRVIDSKEEEEEEMSRDVYAVGNGEEEEEAEEGPPAAEEEEEEEDADHVKEEPEIRPARRGRPPKSAKARPEPPKARLEPAKPVAKSRRNLSKVDNFPDGTLVWAKADSFPWWPAVVHSDDSTDVPGNILQAHKEKRQKRKLKLYIVQFYDKQESWQSVPRDKLQLLGEDNALDERYLDSSPIQKWKASASKQQCREAYRRALAEMEADGSHTAEDTADH